VSRARVVRACALAIVGLAACADDGAVHVRVLWPESAQLSPVSSELARLTLVTESAGAPAQASTRDVPATGGGTVSFGALPLAAGVRISLLGHTAAGRLVGYGRASVPIDVDGGTVHEVPIRVRRPFAYVSGGARLQVFDTTVEAGQPFASELEAAATPSAVATTPDGAEVVVLSGTTLTLFSTGNHRRTTAATATLAPGGRRVAVSPDSRWAVALHEDGISVVDLEVLRRGPATPVFVAIADAGAVAVSAATAHVLALPSVPGPPPAYLEDCSQASEIVPVPLAAPRAGTRITLAGAARDLAVTPDGGTIFAAQPCQGAVVAITSGGATQVRILTVPGATDVSIAGGRVHAVGAASQPGGVHLVLASAQLDGRGATRLDLPATQELAQSRDLSGNGQAAEVRIDADRLDAFALSVLPDGRHVALLVHGSYHADEVVLPVDIAGIEYDETILPRMDVEAYEYQLIDLTTGTLAQRLRTSCKIDWERNVAVLDDWRCASAAGHGSAMEDFVPRQAAVLFGAP
jgi:hypothetical protein